MIPVFKSVIISVRCGFISVTVTADCVTVRSACGATCKSITRHTMTAVSYTDARDRSDMKYEIHNDVQQA
jgi:hypothetical protein